MTDIDTTISIVTRDPNPDAIEALDDLLARAKKGDVIGVLVVCNIAGVDNVTQTCIAGEIDLIETVAFAERAKIQALKDWADLATKGQ